MEIKVNGVWITVKDIKYTSETNEAEVRSCSQMPLGVTCGTYGYDMQPIVTYSQTTVLSFLSAALLRFWDAIDSEWLELCGYVF